MGPCACTSFYFPQVPVLVWITFGLGAEGLEEINK